MARLRRQSEQQARWRRWASGRWRARTSPSWRREAVERMRETLARRARRGARRAGARSPPGARSAARPAASRFEIHTGDEVFGALVGVVTARGRVRRRGGHFLRGGRQRARDRASGACAARSRCATQALHDPLTGLANRALCRERIDARAGAVRARGRRSACVLFIDLDNFKRVNDLYGHAAGDALLIALARRLVATVRPGRHRRAAGRRRVRRRVRGHRRAHGDRARPAPGRGDPRADGRRRAVEHRLAASIGIALGAARAARPGRAARPTPTPRPTGPRARDAGGWRCSTSGLRRHARERLRTESGARARARRSGSSARLPADRVARRRRGRRPRGAAALGLAGRRDDRPGGVHPGRRGVGADHRDRRVGAEQACREPARRSVAETGALDLGQPLRAARSRSPTCWRWSRARCARAGCAAVACARADRDACCSA